MNEQEFCDSIDCRFPYNNEKKSYELIDTALSISNECVCTVLHELARVPRYTKVSKEKLHKMVNYIDDKFQHEMKKEMFYVAREMVDGNELSCDEVIKIYEKLKNHRDISGFSCYLYFASDDTEGIVDKKAEEIREYWIEKDKK